jgi:hypothetical protein
MGEKGNLEAAGELAGSVVGTTGGSVVERTTATVVSSVTSTGSQLADSIRDAGIAAVADHVVAEGRERLARSEEEESQDRPS